MTKTKILIRTLSFFLAILMIFTSVPLTKIQAADTPGYREDFPLLEYSTPINIFGDYDESFGFSAKMSAFLTGKHITAESMWENIYEKVLYETVCEKDIFTETLEAGKKTAEIADIAVNFSKGTLDLLNKEFPALNLASKMVLFTQIYNEIVQDHFSYVFLQADFLSYLAQNGTESWTRKAAASLTNMICSKAIEDICIDFSKRLLDFDIDIAIDSLKKTAIKAWNNISLDDLKYFKNLLVSVEVVLAVKDFIYLLTGEDQKLENYLNLIAYTNLRLDLYGYHQQLKAQKDYVSMHSSFDVILKMTKAIHLSFENMFSKNYFNKILNSDKYLVAERNKVKSLTIDNYKKTKGYTLLSPEYNGKTLYINPELNGYPLPELGIRYGVKTKYVVTAKNNAFKLSSDKSTILLTGSTGTGNIKITVEKQNGKSYSINIPVDVSYVGLVKNLTAKSYTNKITLSWDKVKNAKGYRVFRLVNGKWKTLKSATAAISYTATELLPGKTETFAVRAYNKINGKVYWAKKYTKIVTATLPETPTKLKATAQTDSTISLSWAKSKGASGYRIFSYNANTKKYEIVLRATRSTTAKIKNLTAGKSYVFAVRAYYNNGNSIFWSPSFSKEKTTTLPEQVKNVQSVFTSEKAAKITWNKVYGATGYAVYSYNATTKKYTRIGITSGLSLSVKNINCQKNSYYAVKAYKKLNGVNYWGKLSSLAKLSAVPSNKQAAYYFNKACAEYNKWILLIDIDVDYSKKYKASNGVTYYKVKHNSINSVKKLKEHLNEFFHKNVYNDTVNNSYIDVNGKLYITEEHAGGTTDKINLNKTTASFIRFEKNKCIYRFTYTYTWPEIFGTSTIKESTEKEMIFNNGHWIFTDNKAIGWSEYTWDGHSPY